MPEDPLSPILIYKKPVVPHLIILFQNGVAENGRAAEETGLDALC